MFNSSGIDERQKIIYQKIEENNSSIFCPDGWFDLSSVWNDIISIGNSRDKKKSTYRSTKNWSKYSTHFLGTVGEICFSIATGVPANLEDIAEGDGNCDFFINGISVDVKSTRYWKNPDLKQYPNPKRWVDYYVLCGVDVERERAKIFGWASREQIMNAPRKDYGYGPQYSLNHSEINKEIKDILVPRKNEKSSK